MTVDILISALDAAGALSIAWATLSVHHKVLHDHKIDAGVFRTMKREQKLAILGITLVLSSFVLELVHINGLV